MFESILEQVQSNNISLEDAHYLIYREMSDVLDPSDIYQLCLALEDIDVAYCFDYLHPVHKDDIDEVFADPSNFLSWLIGAKIRNDFEYIDLNHELGHIEFLTEDDLYQNAKEFVFYDVYKAVEWGEVSWSALAHEAGLYELEANLKEVEAALSISE